MSQMDAILKHLKEWGMMALITSLFNSAVWTSFTKGSCILKDDSKLKQVGPNYSFFSRGDILIRAE